MTEDKSSIEGEYLPIMSDNGRSEGYDSGGDVNLGGRPRLYETPEDFDIRVDEYYHYCMNNPTTEPLTLMGLILFMGFADYKHFERYRAYEGFNPAVSRARTLVEYGYEKTVLLKNNGAAGRLLGAMNGFWNPAVKVETEDTIMTHEDRLAHLR